MATKAMAKKAQATITELQARIAELEAVQAQVEVLNQVGRGLNAARDDDELLRIMAQPAVEAGATGAALTYIDLDETGEPEWIELVALWRQEDKPSTLLGSRIRLLEFPSSDPLLSVTNEPQFIADAANDERVNENFAALLSRIRGQALVIIPLVPAGRWMGIVAFTWDKTHEFSQQEAEIYRALMNIATPVVENRRLLAQTQSILLESEMLYDITRGLNVVRNDDELLQILAVPGIGAGARNANMFYVDLDDAGEAEWIEMVAAWRWDGTPSEAIGNRFYLPEFPFTSLWMSSPNEPQLIADVATDERVDEHSRDLLLQRGRRALAVVPLNQAGRWVGIITLGWDEPHEFGTQETGLYQALSSLVTPAVENRRLLIEMQKARAKSDLLYAISRSLSAARDETELLHALIQPIQDTGVSQASLMYIDVADETGEPEWLEIVAVWAAKAESRPTGPVPGTRFYLPQFPFSRLWINSQDEPQIVPDLATAEGMDENFKNLMLQMGSRAMAVIPLARAGRWVGIVNLQWNKAHEFSEQEVELYHTLMGLVTPAVESRRLLIEKERTVVETLYEISRGLNVARDEEELLRVLAQPALEAGAISGSLMYFDLDETNEPEWIESIANWQPEGTLDIPVIPPGTRFHSSEFPLSDSWMSSPDKPQLISDVNTDEQLDENSRNLVAQSGIRAIAIVPLSQAGRWVGIISFGWDQPHEFSPQEAEIYDAIDGLAAPTVDNRRLVNNLERIIDERTSELQVFRQLAENASIGIWLFDPDGRMAYANAAEVTTHGYEHSEEMIGLTIADVVVDEESKHLEEIIPTVLSGGWHGELYMKRKDGSHFPADVTIFSITDEEERSVAIAGITRDITARKQAEAERQRTQAENLRLQQEVIEAQQLTLQELSTPIIPVMETPQGGIIVIPLIGNIDSNRARDITRALLAGIQHHRAKVVILDITGVPVVDSGVANHLNKTIRAARLKGARAIITGISDAVAETIVDLGIDWSNIDTLNDLQTGLLVAMNSLGIKLTR